MSCFSYDKGHALQTESSGERRERERAIEREREGEKKRERISHLSTLN